jgi:hypothetical protein
MRKPKLKPGDRVELTDEAIRRGLDYRRISRTGVVVEVGYLNSDYVLVHRDGVKRAEPYLASFWKRRTDSASVSPCNRAEQAAPADLEATE